MQSPMCWLCKDPSWGQSRHSRPINSLAEVFPWSTGIQRQPQHIWTRHPSGTFWNPGSLSPTCSLSHAFAYGLGTTCCVNPFTVMQPLHSHPRLCTLLWRSFFFIQPPVNPLCSLGARKCRLNGHFSIPCPNTDSVVLMVVMSLAFGIPPTSTSKAFHSCSSGIHKCYNSHALSTLVQSTLDKQFKAVDS